MPDGVTEQEVLRIRPGMPLAERQRLRAQILEHQLDEARRRAAETYLSSRCLGHQPHRSSSMSEAQRRLEHTLCKGESMGDGCLCAWHDEEMPAAEP